MKPGNKPPVKKNQVIQSTCVGIGEKGDGIFKIERYVIIVKDAKKNREYNIKITKVLPKLAFGEILSDGDVSI